MSGLAKLKKIDSKAVAVVVIIFVIFYGLFNLKKEGPKRVFKENSVTKSKKKFIDEYNYILYVINNGSNRLHLKGGQMPPNLVPKDIAPKIACFVTTVFQKKSCPNRVDPNARGYYTSNCGGCHGNDGKGIKGIYPNLTKPLKGFIKK